VRAGEWLLHSGIQEESGGVARYHHTGTGSNLPVSTEITGYAVSAYAYLHSASGDARYLDAARRAAQFLIRTWDFEVRVMPFELDPASYTYFFDCGIIVRGLLAAWRATREQEYRDIAIAIGESMTDNFASRSGDYHPILALPGKTPVERDPLRWSRSPGCYQLKSAMAWWDLFELTGDECFRTSYEQVLETSLAEYRDFLPGHTDRERVMDRLHAFCYFLEGLLPRVSEPRCAAALAEGIDIVARYLREIAPEFVRSDVFAQLLRTRVYADALGVLPLDRACAGWEAAQLAAFQRTDGGYWFGRRAGAWLPFSNPVSTVFAGQALEFWNGTLAPRELLI
jgi:hypothetical protein